MKTISHNMMNKFERPSRRRAFTLIELLVVITIIGIIAAFALVSLKSISRTKKVSVAQGELAQIETALDNYKGKYGNYPPGNSGNGMTSQLYYELSGVTNNAGVFQTLDGSSSISQPAYASVFGSAGVLNCTKGSGDDASLAKNFLLGLSSKDIGAFTNGVPASILITSVGGPDDKYLAGLASQGFSGNPFRYRYPGVQNLGGYDLWVQLVTSPGQTNLVCNWSKATQLNTSFP